ncbi:hypothetical protein QTP88_026967 [Uroleucon formosanum]
MENHEANTVAYHFVTSCVCLHGIPSMLVSDQGTEFLSKILAETCKLLKIKKCNTSPYHPQANGALERSHRTLGEYLRHFVDKDQMNWDTFILYAMFVFNSSEHRSTGKQPYELLIETETPSSTSISYRSSDRTETKKRRRSMVKDRYKSASMWEIVYYSKTTHEKGNLVLNGLDHMRTMIRFSALCTGQIRYGTEQQLEAVNNVINVTPFLDHQGLYYEYHDSVKLSHINWDLVAFIDLSTSGVQYSVIRSQYEATVKVREQMTERFGSVEILDTCKQFVQVFRRATLPYLYEIESSNRNMQLTLGEHNIEKGRVRRGLINAVQKMTNVLYGIYSKIDVEFIFNKILELNQNREQSITFIPERTRITQVEPDH